MNKNIFILLGAHNGSIINKLTPDKIKQVYNQDFIFDKIYLFEPNPYHFDKLSEISSNDEKIIFYNKAANVENSVVDFYIRGQEEYCSSTSDKDKKTGQLFEVVKVETIDFIEWIKNNTDDNDSLFIDIDIECDEYILLPKLIESNITDRIKFISIEFHTNKSNYWSKDGMDEKIRNNTISFFNGRFLDHNKYFL